MAGLKVESLVKKHLDCHNSEIFDRVTYTPGFCKTLTLITRKNKWSVVLGLSYWPKSSVPSDCAVPQWILVSITPGLRHKVSSHWHRWCPIAILTVVSWGNECRKSVRSSSVSVSFHLDIIGYISSRIKNGIHPGLQFRPSVFLWILEWRRPQKNAEKSHLKPENRHFLVSSWWCEGEGSLRLVFACTEISITTHEIVSCISVCAAVKTWLCKCEREARHRQSIALPVTHTKRDVASLSILFQQFWISFPEKLILFPVHNPTAMLSRFCCCFFVMLCCSFCP